MKHRSHYQFAAFALSAILSYSAVAGDHVVFRPERKTVQFKHNDREYSVDINSAVDSLYSDDEPAPSLGSKWAKTYDWEGWWNGILGVLDGYAVSPNWDSAAQDLYEIGQELGYNSDQLLMLTYAFVRHLSKSVDREYWDSREVYFPVEALYHGPSSPHQAVQVTAGLLSALCFDIQLIAVRDSWKLAVVASKNISGEKYVVDGFVYKILNEGPFKRKWSPNDNAYTARAVDIVEMCSVKKKTTEYVTTQEPIREEIRTRAHSSGVYSSIATNVDRSSVSSSGGLGGDAGVGGGAMASADMAWAQSADRAIEDYAIYFAEEAPSGATRTRTVTREVTKDVAIGRQAPPNLVLFGDKDGEFAKIKVTRLE